MEVAAKLGAHGAVALLAQAQLPLLEAMTKLAEWEAAKARAERGTEFTDHRSWN